MSNVPSHLPNFCAVPWNSISHNNEKTLMPCCHINTDGFGATVDEYFKSPELKQLRADFLDGKKPEMCFKCFDYEDLGMKSPRQKINETTDGDFTLSDNNIQYIDYQFGNVCNLACNICGSWNSSKWYAESKKYTTAEFNFPLVTPFNPTATTPELFTSLIERTSKLKFISLLGGEPFYTKEAEHLSLLDKLYKKCPSTTIKYTTNASIYPSQAIIDAIMKFKRVIINMSIDGTSDTFEYGRWPAKWTLVNDTFDQFAELASANSHVKLQTSYVISIISLLDIPQFNEWLASKNCVVQSRFDMLYQPAKYRLAILPKSVKDSIVEYFDSIDQAKITPTIKSALVAMNANSIEQTGDEYNELIAYLRHIDTFRNRTIEESMPLLAKLLGLNDG
jgi:pyruvate-formate lyase-activating enzyme